MSKFNKLVFVFVSFFLTAHAIAQTHALVQGWNLEGNDNGAAVDPNAIFGNATTANSISPSVTTVWIWDKNALKWNFFAPSMTPQALSTYASSKGYGVLSSIPQGQGFWVNAKNAVSVDLAATIPPVVSPDAKKIGTSYIARNGMLVTLVSFISSDLGNGYSRYTATYKQENTTTTSMSEGNLKLYFSNSAAMPQYGGFGNVLPGTSFAVTRSYQFDAINSASPSVLEYDADNFFSLVPITGSLQWVFPIN